MVHVMRKLEEIELKTAAAAKGGEEMTRNDDEEISNTNHNSLMDLRPTHSNILRSPVSPPPLSKFGRQKPHRCEHSQNAPRHKVRNSPFASAIETKAAKNVPQINEHSRPSLRGNLISLS